MSQFDPPWDPARTQKGVGPKGQSETTSPPPQTDYSRYRLGSRLGATGQVYEAYNPRFPGRLVVKLFPFAAGIPGQAVGAFTLEAGRVADLRHPHIVQVFHPGTFGDGTPFVAMERLFGETLEERIANRGALPVSELLPIVRGLASALAAAHAVGVIHRELRADNVFIADVVGYELGFAKILDFGVSRLTAAARLAGRMVGVGPLQFLAPEQRPDQAAVPRNGADAQDQAPDQANERTDQFALAALTHRLLTGADPVAAEQGGPGSERQGDGGARSAIFFGQCAPAVEAVLARALSRRPEDRYDSVAHFFNAFEQGLIRTSGISTPAPIERQVPAELPARTERISRARSEAPTKPTVVNPGASLTQQFFVEGERQEANHWDDSPLAAEEVVDDRAMAFDSFDRIPKRRMPLVAAGVLVVVGLGITAWATGWLSPVERLSADVGKTLHQLDEASPPTERVTSMNDRPAPRVSPPVAAVPAPAPAPPPPPTPAAAPAPAAAVVASPAPLPPPAVAPVAAAAAPPPRAAAPPPREQPLPPAPVSAPVARARPVTSAPPIAVAPTAAAPPVDGPGLTSSDGRPTPLRGYVWSPERRRLVQARVPRLPPLQTESPPPPPMSELP